ncbi:MULTISPECIES: RNA polymerase sigma factor [Aquimarina]|uniref:RNA polymerase sigma factor n=1 Tax=Aquimarina TaxID=290174 RepID=UPI000D691FDF|nr:MULTISPECIES: sigma-70 family RNA polymerase sigma factor [Aquimarina]
MSSTEERKILEGIVAGDEVIITTFYKQNLQYVRQYILQNSGNESDVEDVFQDALVLIYQKLKADSLELHSSLRTYFYGVCKNIWRNRLRKNKKMVITEEIPDDAESIPPAVIEYIAQKEQEHVYRKHFLKLSDSCREILQLLFQGKSMKDIATITGYSEGYTRKKKFDCKRSLIQMIEKDPIYQELYLTPEKK